MEYGDRYASADYPFGSVLRKYSDVFTLQYQEGGPQDESMYGSLPARLIVEGISYIDCKTLAVGFALAARLSSLTAKTTPAARVYI